MQESSHYLQETKIYSINQIKCRVTIPDVQLTTTRSKKKTARITIIHLMFSVLGRHQIHKFSTAKVVLEHL